MTHRYWVRAMKCQLLMASLFVTLLGISLSILTLVTYYGKHFTVMKDVSLEKRSYYRTFHTVVCPIGLGLSIILVLAALLSIVATVRELESAMAVTPCLEWKICDGSPATKHCPLGFFCFVVVFCASLQATYWTVTDSIVVVVPKPRTMVRVNYGLLKQAMVENAVMDAYDFVYEDVRTNISNPRRQELQSIHETFLCCGKKYPFGEPSNIEKEMCHSETEGSTQKHCLPEIQHFVEKHMSFVSVLMSITVFFMVYGMFLTSFLWISIHFKNSLDRKGKYVLTRQ